MKRILAFGLVAAAGSALHAQAINVRGKVSNGAGQPVSNAIVELLQHGLKDTTATDGSYSLLKPSVSLRPGAAAPADAMRLDRGRSGFTMSRTSPLAIEVFDAGGRLLKRESPASPRSLGGILAKRAAAVDTLKVTAAGYAPKQVGLDTYDTTVDLTLDPDATVVYKPCPTDGTPCKILPFGDSITEGVGSSDGAGYRSQLFKLIVEAGRKATFVGSQSKGPATVAGAAFPRNHEGRPGWTIDPGISEFPGYGGISSLVPRPALDGNPHIILLHIGANEFFTKDKATIATRLEALVEKLAQNAPNALIVIAQNTPIGNSNGGHTQAQTDAANAARLAFIGRIPAIIQAQVAKGRHVIGVDMSKMPLTSLTPNSMHPNNQGYVHMAGIWYAGIRDLLPR